MVNNPLYFWYLEYKHSTTKYWRCRHKVTTFYKYGITRTVGFHLLYWVYKSSMAVHSEPGYKYSSKGYKITSNTLGGLGGIVIGVFASFIWPISTPLTLINVHERVKKGEGFFFGDFHGQPSSWRPRSWRPDEKPPTKFWFNEKCASICKACFL